MGREGAETGYSAPPGGPNPPRPATKTATHMTMKGHKPILAALAAGLLLSYSCSLKEDRGGCPCRLTVRMEDAARHGRTAAVSLWADGGVLLAESVATADYREDSPYERDVPKGYVRTSVSTGAGASGASAGRVTFRSGVDCDTIWAHTALVDCRRETALDTARLHRQFAGVHVVLDRAPGGDGERTYTLETGCGGLDLLTLEALPGGWELILEMPSDGHAVTRIPRLSDGMAFFLRIGETGGDSFRVDLQAILREAGYSWRKKDLDDIWIGLDYVRGTAEVTIEPWRGGDTYDETI